MSINGERNGSTLKFSCLARSMHRRSLLGYSPWGCTELDITQQLSNNNNDHKGCICILQYTCIIILVFTTICEQISLLTFGDNILVCDFLPKNSSEVVISYTEARTWNLKSSALLSLICNTLTRSLGFSVLLCANKPSSDAFACAWCWKALTKYVGPMGL